MKWNARRGPASRRRGLAWTWCLLAAAAGVAASACLRDITAPWEFGMRGANGGHYSSGAVLHTLHYGLEVTLGMPVFVTECDGGLTKDVN